MEDHREVVARLEGHRLAVVGLVDLNGPPRRRGPLSFADEEGAGVLGVLRRTEPPREAGLPAGQAADGLGGRRRERDDAVFGHDVVTDLGRFGAGAADVVVVAAVTLDAAVPRADLRRPGAAGRRGRLGRERGDATRARVLGELGV